MLAPGHDLSFFDFENTYWRERQRSNLVMVHYGDMKADLVGEMRRISEFLQIDTPEALLVELANAAQFENMKAQGAVLLPAIGETFDGGHERFLNKGSNGRWKDILTADDLRRYAAVVQRKFSPALAGWVEHGRLKAGDPAGSPD